MDFLLNSIPWILAFALAVSVHESAHAFVAYILGDPTAKYQGRITLNPLKHIDLFGLLFLLYAHFGWARPVPVNPKNFDHPRLHMALVAVAGPVSNILLALIALSIIKVLGGNMTAYPPQAVVWLFSFLHIFFQLNVLLAVFNLIPLHPLDGEEVLSLLIPRRWLARYEFIAGHGPLILFGAIGVAWIFGWNVLAIILVPMANYLATFLEFLVFF